jgi:hypothetical protein
MADDTRELHARVADSETLDHRDERICFDAFAVTDEEKVGRKQRAK